MNKKAKQILESYDSDVNLTILDIANMHNVTKHYVYLLLKSERNWCSNKMHVATNCESRKKAKLTSDYVLKNHKNKTTKELADELKISYSNVNYALKKNGIKAVESKRGRKPNLNLADVERYVENNFDKKTVSEMAADYDCSYNLILHTMRNLQYKPLKKMNDNKKYILANYPQKTQLQIASDLGITKQAVHHYIKNLRNTNAWKK